MARRDLGGAEAVLPAFPDRLERVPLDGLDHGCEGHAEADSEGFPKALSGEAMVQINPTVHYITRSCRSDRVPNQLAEEVLDHAAENLTSVR